MKAFASSAALVSAVMTAACQTTAANAPTTTTASSVEPFRMVSMNLPPLVRPDGPAIGDVFVYSDANGEPVENRIVAMDGSLMTGRSSDGCEYVLDRSGYAKNVAWRNCDGFSGEAEITSTGGIFPLRLGASETMEVSGRSGDERWRTTRTCTVDATGVAEVPAGAFNAYRVFCEDGDGRTTRTFVVDADTGMTVYWNRVRDGVLRQSGALAEIRRVGV